MTLPAHLEKWAEPITVGNHGFVYLVDVMGNDERVVQRARKSYNTHATAKPNTTRNSEKLIRHMLREGHMSPFEGCHIELHIKAPLFVVQQLLRHRTGKPNQLSARYTAIDEEFYVPDTLRAQSTTNKQGSGLGQVSGRFDARIAVQQAAFKVYRDDLDAGVSRELARTVLPHGTYSELYWNQDLRNLLHLLRLRMDSHAQQEIRDYANVIAQMVADWMPLTWRAFRDYRLLGMTLSRMEVCAIADYIKRLRTGDDPLGTLDSYEGMQLTKRERTALLAKMERLGI